MLHIISDNFVERKLTGLMADSDDRTFRDKSLSGFFVRVRRNSKGALSVTYGVGWYTENGAKWNKMTIGDGSTYTADEARQKARDHLQTLADGDDPKVKREARKAEPKFEDLLDDYREGELSEKTPGTIKSYEGKIRRVLLPAFKGMRVKDITPVMIDELRRKNRHRKGELNRAFATGSRMMTLAIRKGWIEHNPFRGAERFPSNERDQWLDEHDLPKFLDELDKTTTPMSDLIRFMTVTGWRVGVARELQWDHVDLKRMTVDLDDSATKKTATVLAADAATILDRQGHRIGYCFSNRGGVTALSYKALREELQRLCKAAGIRQITPHVLRHSAATYAALNGASAFEMMQSIGWESIAMAQKYVKKAENLSRSGAEKAASGVNIFRKPKAEVIPLRKGQE